MYHCEAVYHTIFFFISHIVKIEMDLRIRIPCFSHVKEEEKLTDGISTHEDQKTSTDTTSVEISIRSDSRSSEMDNFNETHEICINANDKWKYLRLSYSQLSYKIQQFWASFDPDTTDLLETTTVFRDQKKYPWIVLLLLYGDPHIEAYLRDDWVCPWMLGTQRMNHHLLHEWAALGGNVSLYRLMYHRHTHDRVVYPVPSYSPTKSYGSLLHLIILGGSKEILYDFIQSNSTTYHQQVLFGTNKYGDSALRTAISVGNSHVLLWMLSLIDRKKLVEETRRIKSQDGLTLLEYAWLNSSNASKLCCLALLLSFKQVNETECFQLIRLARADRWIEDEDETDKETDYMCRVFQWELLRRVTSNVAARSAIEVEQLAALRKIHYSSWREMCADLSESFETEKFKTNQLCKAVIDEDFDGIISWLLLRGARPDSCSAREMNQWTPLHCLVQSEWANDRRTKRPWLAMKISFAVWCLCRFDADPNAREIVNDWTPLHFAAMKGNFYSIYSLVHCAGANPNPLTRFEGEFPLWYIVESCVEPHLQKRCFIRTAKEWEDLFVFMRQHGALVHPEQLEPPDDSRMLDTWDWVNRLDFKRWVKLVKKTAEMMMYE